MTLQTRQERIAMFHRLLCELPKGPDRDAEIMRSSGVTLFDLRWVIGALRVANRHADSPAEEQRLARRRESIDSLVYWDDMPAEDRHALAVAVDDLLLRFAVEGAMKWQLLTITALKANPSRRGQRRDSAS